MRHPWPPQQAPWRLAPPAAALLAAIAALSSAAAQAQPDARSEIDALRRELAEQRALIEKLMAAQARSAATAPQAREAPGALDVQTGGPQRGSGLQAGAPAGPAIPGLSIYGVADVNLAHADSGYGAKTTLGRAATPRRALA